MHLVFIQVVALAHEYNRETEYNGSKIIVKISGINYIWFAKARDLIPSTFRTHISQLAFQGEGLPLKSLWT